MRGVIALLFIVVAVVEMKPFFDFFAPGNKCDISPSSIRGLRDRQSHPFSDVVTGSRDRLPFSDEIIIVLLFRFHSQLRLFRSASTAPAQQASSSTPSTSNEPPPSSVPWFLQTKPEDKPLTDEEIQERLSHESRRLAQYASKAEALKKQKDAKAEALKKQKDAKAEALKKQKDAKAEALKKQKDARIKQKEAVKKNKEKDKEEKRFYSPRCFLTPKEIEDIRTEVSLGPKRPSAKLLREIHGEVQEALKEKMAQESCSVCDRFMPALSTKKIPIDEQNRIICAMQSRLRHNGDLHPELLNQYSIDDILLKDLLLSPRGVIIKELAESLHGVNTTVRKKLLNVCHECLKALKNKKETPPKWAIANGFYTGLLPEKLWNAAAKKGHCEFRMTSLSTMSAVRIVVHDAHGHLAGHALLYDNNVTTPASKLPRVFNKDGEAEMFVVFASSLQDRQRLRQLQRHLADYTLMMKLLDHYRAWNPSYAHVEIPPENAAVYEKGLPNSMTLTSEYDVGNQKEKEAQGPSTTRSAQRLRLPSAPRRPTAHLYSSIIFTFFQKCSFLHYQFS